MYQEIRYDHIWGPAVDKYQLSPEEDGILAVASIDGWKTGQDGGQGEVIANVILTRHGDVVVDFHNNVARVNESVLSAVNEARRKLKRVWHDERSRRRRPSRTGGDRARFQKVLYVPASVLHTIRGYLQAQAEDEYQGQDDTIVYSISFPDGKEMDIKCCGCQQEPSWTEAVLFDEMGCQLTYTDVGEEYEGIWELEYDGVCYCVDVRSGSVNSANCPE